MWYLPESFHIGRNSHPQLTLTDRLGEFFALVSVAFVSITLLFLSLFIFSVKASLIQELCKALRVKRDRQVCNSRDSCAYDMQCVKAEEHMDRLKSLQQCKHRMYSKSFAKQRTQNAAEIKIFTQPLLTQTRLCLEGGITSSQENKLLSNHKNNKDMIIIRCILPKLDKGSVSELYRDLIKTPLIFSIIHRLLMFLTFCSSYTADVEIVKS
ncbi:unnamed protein product [Chrysodeixis includens]|uniref:Uncharacterized protein n=1 Tax=Chrysodeixis includens TaxID=689277 RepID=A0A9P0FQL7_CHRIL|nr:unnamed protein product [Chrysodeixis includens]